MAVIIAFGNHRVLKHHNILRSEMDKTPKALVERS